MVPVYSTNDWFSNLLAQPPRNLKMPIIIVKHEFPETLLYSVYAANRDSDHYALTVSSLETSTSSSASTTWLIVLATAAMR